MTAVLVMIAVLTAGMRAIVLENYTRLERDSVERDLQQATLLLEQWGTALSAISRDWAEWDDTSRFADNLNPAYIAQNLTPQTFASLNTNLFLIVDPEGEVRCAVAFDAGRGLEAPIPGRLSRYLTPGSPLVHHASLNSSAFGLIRTTDGLMLAASRPISSSDAGAPLQGALIWAFFLDEQRAAALGEIVQSAVAFYPLEDLPARLEETAGRLTAAPQEPLVEPIDGRTVAGYSLLRDVLGEPVAVLEVSSPRPIYMQGRSIVLLVVGAAALAALMIVALAVIEIERGVLAPLARLKENLLHIREASGRVSVHGRYELAQLASAVNNMLAALEGSHASIRESEERYRRLVELAPLAIAVNLEGRVAYINPAGARMLCVGSPDEVIGRSVLDFVPPDERQQTIELMEHSTEGAGEVSHHQQVLRLDGVSIDVELLWMPITFQNKPATLLLARDVTETHQAEQALAEANQRLQATVNALPDLLFVLDAEGRIRSFHTPDPYDLFAPPDRFLGQRVVDIMPPDTAATIEQALDEAARAGHVSGVRYQLDTPRGTRWYELSISSAGTSRLPDFAMVALVRDVTPQVLAARSLRDREEQFRSIFEGAAIGMALVDRRGRFLETNTVFTELLSYQAPDLRGRVFTELCHPDDYAAAEAQWQELLTGHSDRYDSELRCLKQGGDAVWVRMRVSRFAGSDPNEPLAIVMVEDITERRRVAEAEREQRALADALRRSAAALNSTLDLDEVLRRLLDSLAAVVPYQVAEILLVEHGIARVAHWAGSVDAYRAGQDVVFAVDETRNLREMARKRRPLLIPDVRRYRGWAKVPAVSWIRAHVGAPICFENEVLGFLSIASDTPGFYTQEHAERLGAFAEQAALAIRNARLYREMAGHLAELAERNSELDAFSHTVAHDLKSPLQIVVGFADLLATDYRHEMSDEVAGYLRHIETYAVKMSQMIESLLLLSRMRTSDQPVRPVEVAPVLAAALDRFTDQIQQLNLTVEVPTLLPPVLGYEPWLEEVFANLIENAIKYIGRDNPNPRIIINADLQESFVRYEVRDNGIGISQDAQAHIFDLGVRFHAGVAAGSGLGLSIVRRIITRLGGEVGVISAIGEGSTFWFTLPSP